MLHVDIFSSLRKFIESSIGNILFDVIYKTLIIIAKSQTTSAVSKVLLPVAVLASVSGVMTRRNNPIICRAAQGVKVYSVLLSPSLLSEKMSFTFWQNIFGHFQLTTYWSENREALLTYIEHVHTGIKGMIFDKTTNAPITSNATIQVSMFKLFFI
jgi:hypothetical protein